MDWDIIYSFPRCGHGPSGLGGPIWPRGRGGCQLPPTIFSVMPRHSSAPTPTYCWMRHCCGPCFPLLLKVWVRPCIASSCDPRCDHTEHGPCVFASQGRGQSFHSVRAMDLHHRRGMAPFCSFRWGGQLLPREGDGGCHLYCFVVSVQE